MAGFNAFVKGLEKAKTCCDNANNNSNRQRHQGVGFRGRHIKGHTCCQDDAQPIIDSSLRGNESGCANQPHDKRRQGAFGHGIPARMFNALLSASGNQSNDAGGNDRCKRGNSQASPSSNAPAHHRHHQNILNAYLMLLLNVHHSL